MIKRILTVITVLILLQTNTILVFCETIAGKASEPPIIKAESVILTDQKTGKVLYEKDSHKRIYPASITKTLTALLVMDDLDMNEIITVGKEIKLVKNDSSEAGLSIDEKISGRDLIWALMLPSGNDAAYTAAVTIARKKSGDASMDTKEAVKYFSDLMNKRAQKIGAEESNFVNPDGYPDENHYSTAYDLALIAGEAMKNDLLRDVVSTYSYKIMNVESTQSSVKGQKNHNTWYNLNQMINSKSKYYYKYATGIKTGYTSLAGYCLAASAVKDDISLIAIVLKADKEETRWLDSKNLFEYGFNNFKYQVLLKKGETISHVKVGRKYFGKEVDLDVLAGKAFTDLLTDNDVTNIKKDIQWDKKLVLAQEDNTGVIKLLGPIKSGQTVGKVTYTFNGKVLVESDLLAAKDALKGDFSGLLDQAIRFKYIVLICIVIIAIGVFMFFKVFMRKEKI